ncbi:DUF3157 family protein [Shewanella surugensis]|uniref:DUF3157 family protein n=1 Tax=Shewanella surugensis TaxID=212020 RepID=A0ABT0L917_9GAMM|nr:DUF3157 family protein [Shewanella surugensis]MCL1124044.1 DUF3157 family protein [Shewanella surugensis]
MHKLQQKYLALFLTLLAGTLPLKVAFADQLAEVVLDNGTTVVLHDDFTWEYVILETPTATTDKMPSITTNTPQTNIIPLNPTPMLNVPPKLNQQVMTQSELLKSTAKDGVKVSILNTQWNDDQLGFQFELTSNSNKHYVLVKLETKFYNDDGTLIKSDNVNVWQATFRLPETYLRKNETRKSRVFWINGIDKAQWHKQLMSFKITELESR